ncbi:MAG: cold-shock protein [Candidatus Omnitrophota bacterium]
MVKGKVKWFNAKKGYGFIEADENDGDIFVHFSEIKQDGYRSLDEGDEVEFEMFNDEKGSKARNVLKM